MRKTKVFIGAVMSLTAFCAIATSAKLPSTATQSEIQAAIDAAEFGETVELAAGTYSLTSQLTLKEGVTLLGSGLTNCTLKANASVYAFYRVIQMKDNATLKGFLITGGHMGTGSWEANSGSGVLAGTNCTISCCCVSNNVCRGGNIYGQGIRIHSGRIDHCIIVDNTAVQSGNVSGGGIGYGSGTQLIGTRGGELTIDTCLIARNSVGLSGNTTGKGGGIYAEWRKLTLLNTTIVGNTANGGVGGGLYLQVASTYSGHGTIRYDIRNCILSNNTAAQGTTGLDGNGAPNWYAASDNTKYIILDADYNLVGDSSLVLGGANSVSGTPLYKSLAQGDYRPEYGSDAIGMAASEERVVDLDGQVRPVGGEDRTVGCYEYIAALQPTSLVIGSFDKELFTDENLSLQADIVNLPSGKVPDYTWYLTNRHHSVVAETVLTGQNPGERLAAGRYSVFVVAHDHTSGELLASKAAEDTVLVAVRTNYVTSVATDAAEFPWDLAGKAATNLVEVLKWTIDGSTVLLDGGEHQLTSPATLDHDVLLKGAGRDLTTLRQTKKARTLILDSAGAVASDMTIADGYFKGLNFSGGANVFISSNGGTVRDCRIIRGLVVPGDAPTHGGHGAGIYSSSDKGLIDRCIITQCTNTHTGTASTHGAIVNLNYGKMRNSLIVDNVCEAQSVVQVGLSAVMDNCTVVKNVTKGTTDGAAAVFAYEYLGHGMVRNVIVADNVAAGGASSGAPNWAGAAAAFNHCCFVGSTSAGTSPIGDNVLFRNAAANDYRLTTGWSSCWNAGLKLDWMSEASARDLDGRPRCVVRNPDVGCYECDPLGLLLLLR